MGVERGDKPSGVVRGECRGGLGGAAAPNRPPSAARRAGGPNNKKRKAPVPAGHTHRLSKDKLGFAFFRAPAPTKHKINPKIENQKNRVKRTFKNVALPGFPNVY